jgi:PAS domain S-box-containing protein
LEKGPRHRLKTSAPSGAGRSPTTRLPWQLLAVVAALSLGLPVLAAFGWLDHARALGFHGGPGTLDAGSTALVDLLNTGIVLACLLLAVLRQRVGNSRAAAVIQAFFPWLALFDALHGLAATSLPTSFGIRLEALESLTWGLSQLWLGGVFLAFGILIFRRKSISASRLRGWLIGVTTPAAIALIGLVLVFLSSYEPEPACLWQAALPLVMVGIGAGLALARWRSEPRSVISGALLLAALPLGAGQLAVLLSLLGVPGSLWLAAEVMRLLAYLVVLGGLVVDAAEFQRQALRAREEASAAHLVLEERTRQLERVDLQLAQQRQEREAAQQRLRILEKAVETMSLGLTITDLDGTILYSNPADARMHGWQPDEVVGQPSLIYSHAPEPAGAPAGPPRLWLRERLNRTKQGRVFPVRLISDPVLGAHGEPTNMVTLCEDITEQRKAAESLERRDRVLEAVGVAAERLLVLGNWQQSLREVLARLGEATGVDRVYFRQVGDPGLRSPIRATWERNPRDLDDSVLLDVRPRTEALELLGEELEEGSALASLVRDLPPALRLGFERRGIQSVAVVPVRVRGRRWGVLSLESNEPERVWSGAETEALKAAARILGGAIQREHAEAALISSEANYRELIETASDLIQSVSVDGELIFVNRAWREALGYGAEDVLGMPVWKVIAPDQHDHCRQVMAEIFSGKGVERLETIFLTRDGTRVPVEGGLSCRLQNGRPVATLGIFRDVTERLLLDRMKQDFISTVSHELRTPLTSMLGSLGLLQSKRVAEHPEKSAELLAIAQRNGERLLRLINDLLDLQRMAAGELSLRSMPTEIEPLLAEAIQGIQPFADSLNVTVERSATSPGVRAVIDRDRMVQILYNLLSNAIKFSPAGQAVLVSTRVVEDQVEISVTDRGPGIPEEFKRRLFSRFAQADNANARRTGGSGLGLSIVRSFVEALGGQIRIDSEVGAGTTITVAFALARDGAP